MVVAFATLRGGLVAGSTTVGVGLAIIIVLAAISGLPSIGVLALFCWTPTAVAAEVLRRTSSLAAAIVVIAVSALVVVLTLVALQGPMDVFWQTSADQLKLIWASGGELSQFPMSKLEDQQVVAILQAGAGFSVLTLCTAGLFFGRSGQAKMVNPNGFQREFHALYFGKQVGIILLALVVLGFFVGGALGLAMITIGLFPLLLQGLAVIHALVKERSLGLGWLFGVYLLMFVQPVVILISGLGLIDNLRRLPRH